MRSRSWAWILLVGLWGCPATEPGEPPPPPPPWEPGWERGLPDTTEFVAPEGWRVARGITHLHSPMSHDACDGDGLPEGRVNEPCLADLRAALCETRQDFAFLSDHPSHFATFGWEQALLLRGEDDPIDLAGGVVEPELAIAKHLRCPDGHIVTWLPGVEDELMPLGLRRHAGDDLDQVALDGLYNRSDPAVVAELRQAGALVFRAHTESRSAAWVAERDLDGIEVYNLHANLGPDIREEHLGLDPFGFAGAVGPWLQDVEAGELVSDLVFLGFYLPNEPSLATWDALTPQRRLVGIAGTDAHQNVLNIPMADGERVDSYRRMLRWFSNHVLLPAGASPTPAAVQQALGEGRAWLAFEALGSPTGLVVQVVDDGDLIGLGEEVPWREGQRLRVQLPEVYGGPPADHALAPEIRARVVRASPTGVEIVAEGDTDVDLPTPGPGAYRVEIEIVPHHLRPLIPGQEELIQPFTWVLTNPIYLR